MNGLCQAQRCLMQLSAEASREAGDEQGLSQEPSRR